MKHVHSIQRGIPCYRPAKFWVLGPSILQAIKTFSSQLGVFCVTLWVWEEVTMGDLHWLTTQKSPLGRDSSNTILTGWTFFGCDILKLSPAETGLAVVSNHFLTEHGLTTWKPAYESCLFVFRISFCCSKLIWTILFFLKQMLTLIIFKIKIVLCVYWLEIVFINIFRSSPFSSSS